MLITGNNILNPPPQPLIPQGGASAHTGLSFSDVLDTVNPLQHIPVVSSVYRAVSGSSISDAAKFAGDALYGLATGNVIASTVASAADIALKQVTGKYMAGTLVSAIPEAKKEAVPLTPDNSVSAAPAKEVASFIPLDFKRTALASGNYSRALALDSVNKKLVKLNA